MRLWPGFFLFALICFGAKDAGAQITVHPWPQVQQAQPQSSTAGTYVVVDAGPSVPATPYVGLLYGNGWGALSYTVYVDTAATIIPNTANQVLELNAGPLIGGPYIPYVADGPGNTAANYYEACQAGTPSLNCPTAQRQWACLDDVVPIIGQSNEVHWHNYSVGSPPAVTNACELMVNGYLDANGYPAAGTSFVPVTNSLVYVANTIFARTGRPVAFIDASVGGAPYTPAEAHLENAGNPTATPPIPHIGGCYGNTICIEDSWLDHTDPPGVGGGGFMWAALKAELALVNNTFAYFILGSGESAILDTPSNIQAALTQITADVQALDTGMLKPPPVFLRRIGLTHVWDQYASFVANVATPGQCPSSNPSIVPGSATGCWANTWQAQNAFVAATPGAFMGAETDDFGFDTPPPVGVHFPADDLTIMSFRMANSILQNFYGYK